MCSYDGGYAAVAEARGGEVATAAAAVYSGGGQHYWGRNGVRAG